MLLAVLSRNATLYTTRRFTAAAKKLGHRTIVIDPLQCVLRLEKKASVIHHGKVLDDVDLVLPRIGNSITEYGLAVVNQFEISGRMSVNPAPAIALTRDKLRCTQALQSNGIPVPATMMVRNPRDLSTAVGLLGGMPVVVKLLQGTQGIGVMLVESMGSLESMVETLWGLGQNLLLQRYIHQAKGRDIRMIVVGDRVVGAMRRCARPGDFRANIHRGGLGEPITPPDEYAEVAVRATQLTGLRVSGVDMLETPDGPLVIEVNSSPGFEAFEKTCDVDIAETILRYSFDLAELSRISKVTA